MSLNVLFNKMVVARKVVLPIATQKPSRDKKDLRKVVLHEVQATPQGYSQTGRRMYLDRDCPVFLHLNNGGDMVIQGHGAVEYAIFNQLAKIVDEQDNLDFDMEDEDEKDDLQSIAEAA